MLRKLRGKKKGKGHHKGKGSQGDALPEDSRPPAVLLVVDTPRRPWAPVFEGATLSDGRRVRVVQGEWSSLAVMTSRSGAMIYIKPIPGVQDGVQCNVDFVLVRQLVRGFKPNEDYRPIAYGLMCAGVPSVNSLHSVVSCAERALLNAAMEELRRQRGHEAFPLIEMYYYDSHRTMSFTPSYPIVVKVGSAEAGYGKLLCADNALFSDVKSVLAVTNHYVTAESYIEGREYDIRVQKVGSHYRAFHRRSSNWKGNVGNSILEQVEVTAEYRQWADCAATLFGGLDILTVDAVFDGKKHYILEINDSPSGFAPDCMKEDQGHVRELVVERMSAALVAGKSPEAAVAACGSEHEANDGSDSSSDVKEV